MDYATQFADRIFKLGCDLSRTQAAGLIGFRCGDGFCGADDCQHCRPSAEPAPTGQELRAAAIDDLNDDESLDKLADCWGNNPDAYLALVREIALAHMAKRPTDTLARQLAERVISDFTYALEQGR